MSSRKETGAGEAPARPDLSQLKTDFERLSQGLGALRQHLVEAGLEGARGVQDLGLAQLDALRRELDEFSGQVRQQGRDTLGQLERSVRERPLASLLVAFGAGMILSRLFGGRGR